jgi:hypothetical protein
LILFLIRIIAGVINGYINLYHYSGTDQAYFHQEGIIEYHLLLNNPKEYFYNIFKFDYPNSGLLDTKDSFWNNLRTDLMIKVLSIFNIFSRGNFFINTIFYNFLIFFGSLYFYRIFTRIFPDHKTLLIFALFLLPSLLYFTAGIHKEGFIFLGLGMACFHLFFAIKQNFTAKRILWILFGLAIIFLLRNFIVITLFPAIAAWIIAERYKKFVLQIFIIVYLFFIILFFNLGSIHSSLNLPQYVSDRQIAFIHISKGGNSAININPLFPHFRSFLNSSPQALNHTLMRPYLTEKFTLLYIPAAIEIFIYQCLFFIFLLFRFKDNKPDAFIYFCVFFSLSMFLMIGYTIPILGAIVRYRSLYFPLILIPFICYTDWGKLKKYLQFKK